VTGLTATQSGYIRDPFANNMITSGFDPVALNMLKYFPSPTCASCGYVNNFTNATGAPVRSTEYTIRGDFNINDKTTAYARWSKKPEEKTEQPEYFGSNNVGGGGSLAPDDRWDAAFGITRMISPTFVASFNAGYGRWIEGRVTQGVPFSPSTVGLPSFLDGFANAFPQIYIDGGYNNASGAALGSGGLNSTPREARSISLDLTKVVGAHNLQFGFMGIELIQNTFNSSIANFHFPLGMTAGPDPTNANPATGWGFASYLLGTGTSGGVTVNADAAFMKKFLGWYFQDAWRMTPKLTVNLGLRYDFQTAPTDRFNRLSYFDFNTPNPISAAAGFSVPGQLQYVGNGLSRGVYRPQMNNFAPRVSLAYEVSNKLVARAGFGLFFTPAIEEGDYEGLTLNGFTQTTPYVGSVDGITPTNLLSNPFPSGLVAPTGRSQGGLTDVGLSPNAVAPFRPTPYVVQWTVGLQYEVTPNDRISASYLGNHGVKQTWSSPTINGDQLSPSYYSLGNNLLQQVPNPFYPYITSSSCGLNDPTVQRGQLLLPFPEYCYIGNVQAPLASSWYDALTVDYRHRWSNGLEFLASYTWSKYLDTNAGNEGWAVGGTSGAENYYNLYNEKSVDGNDVPQSLVLSYIYQLPFGRGEKFGSTMSGPANAILGGWQFSGITSFKSGIPIAFTAPGFSFGQGQRPNVTCNPSLSNPTLNEWFNTSCFAKPAPYTFGDASRFLPNPRAPGFNNWDLGLMKWFDLPKVKSDTLRMQFRAEFFNAFNHENFFRPDSNLTDATFGKVTNGLGPRDIQLALKLFW
jgi:hypothetical protein